MLKMPEEQAQLPTISSKIIDLGSRTQAVRHSLPAATTLPPPGTSPNRSRSQSQTTRPFQIVLQPSIPEGDGEDEETSANNGGTKRGSFIKKPASRSNSMTGVKAKIIEVKGYDSGTNDDQSQGSFRRGLDDSTRSSTHGSVQSLQVQREQYCCFSRWSPFERRLATSVGVLGGVIVGLVIAVGFLARSNGVDETFIWKP